MDRWSCLLGIQLLQHTDIVSLVWVDDMDPVLVITVALFRSYSKAQIEIIVSYNDSTLGYIQFFPVSTCLEYADMKHVKEIKQY